MSLAKTFSIAAVLAAVLLLRGNNITISGYAVNDPDSVADPIAHY